MKFNSLSLLLFLAASLVASPPLSAAPGAGSSLIVPGHRIGQTKLGLNGDRALTAEPNFSDASMGGKLDRIWLSKDGVNTLYVHTRRNDSQDPPRPGVTVSEIRVTSPLFHTQNAVAPGTPFALIQRCFPAGRLTRDGHFYVAARQGIAFEFPQPPRPGTRSLAVSIFPPGPARDFRNGGLATRAFVQSLLNSMTLMKN